MAKRTTVGDIQPPARGEKKSVKMFDASKEGDTTQLSNRINSGHARYLRLLAASTGKSQKELLEQAIDLLRAEAGEI
ncbi:hypothetical protein [uncultured Ruegeria sp.]|uniref:hypothetical protein n=1 Tax=uncultured Ruegeria sp. TaxID=259304 RepID=UPI00261C3A39|nr:hypothetical protein [uncultured Ruegeria sp.]